MKKLLRWALALGLCLTLTVCVALADEAPTIAVQLDGQALTFTDAVPQVKDQRTFLPFRAVFEAMGAEVSNEGSVITAVRGDKTLVMILDQTQAAVTEKGVTTPITMDVAPYVDPTTWRTYVPVRFAAQAFGCAVGWDQDAYTAVIVDSEKLLADALEGKSFTTLEKMAALEGKYDQGIWDVTASFDADASVMAMPMTISGTMSGTMQDADKMDVDMNMKMDMSGLAQALSAMGAAPDAEDLAQMEALKTQGVDLTMRGDLAQGKFYVNMDLSALGAAAAEAGMDGSAWYEVDMAALMAQAGADMDWATLLKQAKELDYVDLAQMVLSAVEPNSAADSYTQIKATVDGLLTAFSDAGFEAKDGKQVATYSLSEQGMTVAGTLALDMDGESVKGYAINLALSAQVGSQSMEMSMDLALDEQDKMNATFTADLAGLMTMEMTMDGQYTPGTTAPETAPPADANVISLMEMMGSSAGVIGGADGPTEIVVD